MRGPRDAADALPRLFHTLRPVPPGQLAALVWQRVRAVVERPERFAAREAPPEPGVRWTPGPLPETGRSPDPGALRAGRFTYLNRTEALGFPPRWQAPSLPRLWLYHLHYFEALDGLAFEAGRALVLDWIASHPLRRGAVGWEPYPTSLRLLAWCGWLFARHRERTEADPELRAAVWPSIWLQAEWLSAHLEHHLGGNHLLENAAALAFCGACFAGPGEAWLARGTALLDRELPSQVLPDGLHYERSPMYHARAAHVLALLQATRHAELLRRVAEPLARMRRALACVCHPDGEIALLNDAAFGTAPRPEVLLPGPPADGPFALPDAGYYGARAGGHYVVCDAAPVGPDAIPGHAHADLLSFELSLAGQRVLVDAGVHGYDGDPLRAWVRSTRAHNTVEIEGADQCELWATFRVARRGRPRDVAWSPAPDGFRLSAWHDGYERLSGRPRHGREFRWYDDGVLLVRDRVTAERSVRAATRLHLHPACAVEILPGHRARVRHPAGAFEVAFAGEGELGLEDSTWCPEFGRREASRALVLHHRGRTTDTGFCVAHDAEGVGYSLAAGAEIRDRRYPW